MTKSISVALLACLVLSTSAFARPVSGKGKILTLKEIQSLPLTSPTKNKSEKNEVPDFDFSGIAALPGCSGSIVSFGQADTAKAILMTNGHCVGLMDSEADAVFYRKPYSSRARAFVNLESTVSVTVTSLIYGIMQPHDIAFLELAETYKQLADKGVKSRKLSPVQAPVGEHIVLASGYFERATDCKILDVVYRLREDKWTNEDVIKYRECNAMHGTSGSPLISVATDEIIGINMTGNDSGEECTFNNPCEVDHAGNIKVDMGAGYGDQVKKVLGCLDASKNFDLSVPGCELPKAK